MNILPAFSFPTEIVVIDDNISQLKSLNINFSESLNIFSFFDDPTKALKYLNNNPPPRNYRDDISNNSLPKETDVQRISFDLKRIHQLKNNNDRFSTISAIIADYRMPSLNGVDLLSSVKFNSRNLLLTAEADEMIAVKAFNKAIINQYIKKDAFDKIISIGNFIEEASRQYFIDATKFIIDDLQAVEVRPKAYLDPVFIKYFKTLLKTKNIVEYYLLDTIGSFLLITGNGESYTLNVQCKDQALFFQENIDEISPQILSPEKKNKIKEYKQILCYSSYEEEPYPQESLWGEYFKDSIEIKGKDSFFVSLQPNLTSNPITISSTFHKYKNTHIPFKL